MVKERQQKYGKEGRYCPPYGYPPINYGKDIPPVEEERKDPPKWYLS